MRYLNENDIHTIGYNWHEIIHTIRSVISLLKSSDYSQPLKPYLRFKDVKNRIIAMPAYVGGEKDVAGIKWIASFPGNIERKKARAHSVVILNETVSGEPVCIINTAVISSIRTAGVTGFVINEFLSNRQNKHAKLNAGIIGFGPIGQMHLQMLDTAFGDHIEKYYLFDVKGVDNNLLDKMGITDKVVLAGNWQEVFNYSEIFITCTVSSDRYINLSPRRGALYLNISLRDFDVAFIEKVDLIIVDNWEEVCRENTDIECAHKTNGLTRDHVFTITDLLNNPGVFANADTSVMFNPMGMAVFDIALAKYYLEMAEQSSVGVCLD